MKYFYYFGFLVLGYFCFNLYNYQSNIFLNKSAYLILSKNNLNKDFGIVASISETDSLNDIIGRPVYSSEINQYYFKEDKNFINLMQPNIGISFSSEYNGNSLSISDRVMLRLPIILSLGNIFIIDMTNLIKSNFYFSVSSRNSYTLNKLYEFYDNKLNIEISYFNKKILYSLSFLDHNFERKEADINHGYFITLTKTYDIFNSKLKHYITRWDCNKNISIFIDKSVPEKWISVFKSGLEKWNLAFKDANSKCNINTISYLDKNWTNFKNGDFKYSSISLAPSNIDRTYAVGHFNFNWKTGEIYRGNIMISGDWLDYWNGQFSFLEKLLIVNLNKNNMCFTKVANYSNHKKNFIRMGMESIITHEMGHILGLRHNFKASSLVPYRKIHNKSRIEREGLIPSIMDYLNLVIDIDNIYSCLTMDCIIKNVKIMNNIGKYDYQTIKYGYGNNKNLKIDYDLGPDEFLRTDALSNMGDISDTPGKYNYKFLKLSSYVLNNYDFKKNVSKFNTYWQEESNFIDLHYRFIVKSINTNLKILSSLSYNFNGEILDIKKTQKESSKFFKYLLQKKLYLNNKIFFKFPRCKVGINYFCQGMYPLNLDVTHDEINNMISTILTSDELEKKMRSNYELSGKTISYETFLNIMNDTLVFVDPLLDLLNLNI